MELEFTSQKKEKEILTPLGSWIQEFNELGKMKIQFNQSLNSEIVFIEDLTSDVIELRIESGNELISKQKLNFEWQATNINYLDGNVELQLNFTDAIMISTGEEMDILEIVILQMQYLQPVGKVQRFLQQKNDQPQIKNSISLVKQMPNTHQSRNLSQTASSANDQLALMTLLLFILNYILSSVFKKIMITIFALQIVVHLGMINVDFPGNTLNFISTIKSVTYFKVFKKLAEMNKHVFKFDFQAQDQLKSQFMLKPLIGLGFKHFNCILNLGNTGQILGLNFFFLSVLIISLTLNFIKKSKFINRRVKVLKNKLIYGPFLRLGYNGYIPFVVSSQLNNQHFLHTFENQSLDRLDGEKSANIFASIVIIFIYFWFPAVLIFTILNPSQNKIKFRKRYAFLLQSIKSETRFQRSFFMVFIIRRLILIETGFRLHQFPSIQIQITMLVNLIMLIYVAGNNFYLSFFDCRMAIISEVFIILATFHLVAYTDFAADLHMQYAMGLSFIFTIGLQLLINVFFVFTDMFRVLRLNIIKKINELQFGRPKEEEQKQNNLDSMNLKKFINSIGRIHIKKQQANKYKVKSKTQDLSIIYEEQNEEDSLRVDNLNLGNSNKFLLFDVSKKITPNSQIGQQETGKSMRRRRIIFKTRESQKIWGELLK